MMMTMTMMVIAEPGDVQYRYRQFGAFRRVERLSLREPLLRPVLPGADGR